MVFAPANGGSISSAAALRISRRLVCPASATLAASHM